jgi:hypothetical protein
MDANEWEMMWKWPAPKMKAYLEIFLEVLMKITKITVIIIICVLGKK